jgi:hypothetical protein
MDDDGSALRVGEKYKSFTDLECAAYLRYIICILPCVWALTAGNGTKMFPSMNTGIIQLLIN